MAMDSMQCCSSLEQKSIEEIKRRDIYYDYSLPNLALYMKTPLRFVLDIWC